MTDSLAANEMAVSVVGVTFVKSLIDSEQVQVDSVMQVERQSPSLHRNRQLRGIFWENGAEITHAKKWQAYPVVG